MSLRVAGTLAGLAACASPATDSATGPEGDSGAVDGADGEDGKEPAPEGVDLDSVTWSIRWDTTDLDPPTQGGAWQVTRGDGAAFEVTRAWVRLETIVVEDCVPGDGRKAAPPHGSPDHPSGFPQPLALALHEPAPVTVGPQAFDGFEVCRFWMISYWDGQAPQGNPAEADLSELSFVMEGHHRPPGAEDWEPLELRSNLQVDVDLWPDLEGATGQVGEITLRPADLFDLVTLPMDDLGRTGWEALSGLIEGAEGALVEAPAEAAQ